ncbi:hypothetical protein [Paracoccus beibuensis]|uniref:hypothetical protein n=1 Tax=Paracoccus beibuensis TaxID=547602 RepID=UPI00223FFFED|nr:hypothetical protein [Paracoccus beibuensis]
MGSVATSLAYKDAEVRIYDRHWQYELIAYDSEAIDFIMVHLANPNDPAEQTVKAGMPSGPNEAYNSAGLQRGGRSASIRVHGWNPTQSNAASFGIDPAVLDTVTIQNHITDVMGAAADGVAEIDKIKAYDYWLRTKSFAERQALKDQALSYFGSPWDLDLPKRINPVVCAFEPHVQTSGRRTLQLVHVRHAGHGGRRQRGSPGRFRFVGRDHRRHRLLGLGGRRFQVT